MIKKIAILFLFIGFALPVQAQFGAKQKNWKIGLNRFSAGINYVYETQVKGSTSDALPTQKLKKTSGGAFSTTDLMIEYIFKGQFGLEVDTSLSPGVRNFTFQHDLSGTTKIGDIVETDKASFLYGANFYFKDHSSDGLKLWIGLMTGEFTSQHSYSNGGDKEDTTKDTLGKFKATQSSTVVVPAQIIRFGLDYIIETVGFRLALEVMNAQAVSSALGKTSSPNSQKQKETVTISGGSVLGIYAHF